jgi:hypothetical protein
MKTLTVISNPFAEGFASSLREMAITCVDEIYQDYFKEKKSYAQFLEENMGHTSLVAKCLAYRFFSTEVFSQLRTGLHERIEKIYGCADYVMHPIFYYRMSYPSLYREERHRNAFFDSQPHYDRAFNLHAFSFWMALEDVDAESGGLCYFDRQETIDLFKPVNGKNIYNYEKYLERAREIDPLVRPHTVQPALPAGSVFTFDSDLLHAATKPTTRRRLSCDFRMLPASEASKADPTSTRIIREFNRSPSFCNALNLLLLGDNRGAARLLNREPDTPAAELSQVAAALAKTALISPVEVVGAKVNWQSEYGWLKC